MQSRSARAFAPSITDDVAPDASFADLLSEIDARDEDGRRRQALAALASLIAREGIDDSELGSLLEAVGRLEWPRTTDEAVRLGAVAGAVGRRRLIAALDDPGVRRLGAVRLLLEAER